MVEMNDSVNSVVANESEMDDQFTEQIGVQEVKSSFYKKDNYHSWYAKEPNGVTWGNRDLTEKTWGEHLGHNRNLTKYRKPTPVFAARTPEAYSGRVKEVYRGITIDASYEHRKEFKRVIKDELISAANPNATGCPHYLEPIYYFGKRLKKVQSG